jgi:hypothetical protein
VQTPLPLPPLPAAVLRAGVSPFLTAREASLVVRVSPKTLNGWAAAGLVPGARRVGRRWLYDGDRLAAWLTGRDAAAVTA